MKSILFSRKYLARDGNLYRIGMTGKVEDDEAAAAVRANVATYTDTTIQAPITREPEQEMETETEPKPRGRRVAGQ